MDRVIADEGYRKIMWTVDTVDWSERYKPDLWVAHGMGQLKGRGDGLILMHDIHKTTADHLDGFIRQIKALGEVEFLDGSDL